MKATDEQRHCKNCLNQPGNLKIEAGAGTGKTTTLGYVIHNAVLRGRALYTSFGKDNVEDTRAKFASINNRPDIKTGHSLAFRSHGSRWADEGRLSKRITANQMVELMGWHNSHFSPYVDRTTGAHLVLRIIQNFCQSGSRHIGQEHVQPVISGRTRTQEAAMRFGLKIEQDAHEVWSRMMTRQDQMPIEHDVYLKAWALTDPQLPYSDIFLDEGQDSSGLMVDLIKKQRARVIVVGDRYQGIYKWRGAFDAMDAFDFERSARLTQSFRFGPAVAEVANAVLAQFLDASMRLRGFDKLSTKVGPIEAPFCTLARTNASLVGELMHRLSINPNARLAVVGGVKDLEDLVKGAEALLDYRPTHVPDLAGFANWGELVSATEDDAYGYLRSFVQLIETYGPPLLLNNLAKLKGNERDEASCEAIFSTAHKSKGREFPTVKLCDDFVERPPDGTEEADKWNPEEGNLLYVSVTRAREALDISNCTAAKLALSMHYDAGQLDEANFADGELALCL